MRRSIMGAHGCRHVRDRSLQGLEASPFALPRTSLPGPQIALQRSRSAAAYPGCSWPRALTLYEHASTVLTSNKGFEEWGAILGVEVMAAALIDRLMHHCHVVNIRGNSYRMREHADLHLASRPGADSTASETVLRRRKKEIPAH
jgi:IstB-like ATP binding protein